MKEVLAKRDKSGYLFITVLGLVSLTVCTTAYFLMMPNYNNSGAPWLPIMAISVSAVVLFLGIICLCFPDRVVVKQGDTIIIYNNFRKAKKVNLSDVIEAKVQPLTANVRETATGNIIITVKEDNQEKEIKAIGVKNKAEAVEKINRIINNV